MSGSAAGDAQIRLLSSTFTIIYDAPIIVHSGIPNFVFSLIKMRGINCFYYIFSLNEHAVALFAKASVLVYLDI